jgi:hypothetical protein
MFEGKIVQNNEAQEPSNLNVASQRLMSEVPLGSVFHSSQFDQASNLLPALQIADSRVVKLPTEPPDPKLLWADQTRGVAARPMRGPSRETGAPIREI